MFLSSLRGDTQVTDRGPPSLNTYLSDQVTKQTKNRHGWLRGKKSNKRPCQTRDRNTMQKVMTCWLSQAVYIDVYREGYYNTQHLNLSCPHAKYRYQYPVPRSAENLHKRTQATAHSQFYFDSSSSTW